MELGKLYRIYGSWRQDRREQAQADDVQQQFFLGDLLDRLVVPAVRVLQRLGTERTACHGAHEPRAANHGPGCRGSRAAHIPGSPYLSNLPARLAELGEASDLLSVPIAGNVAKL